MLNLENRKIIFAICLCFFGLSLECFGNDESTPPDWQAKVDQFFGEHVVSPLADLLFWKIPGTNYYEDGSPVYSFSSSQVRHLTDQNATGGNYTFDKGNLKAALLKDGRWEYPKTPASTTFKTNYANFSKSPKEYLKNENVDPIGFISIPKGFPLIVAWLLGGALFFTLRMRFVNLRLFKHAIDLVRGKYDSKDQKGEVSHFQALTTALSATVGLGNIAGVAIAIGTGGPGATFWIILVGFLGMSSKFTECVLGQKYRKIRKDGKIMGGAMHYLSDGLKDLNLKHLGGLLAGLFCILCIGGSFGGGNAFQVVQSLDLIKSVFPALKSYPWAYGLIMTILVGLVILGGIKGIASVASRIVPAMCAIYLLACLVILGMHFDAIPAAIALIFKSAFSFEAGFGGFLGILVIGVKRAVFSNEAGIGSAAIAHSAAKVSHPTEEGVVALLEPFIDTIVVCTMTALVIIITGVYEPLTFTTDSGEQSMIQSYIDGNKGGALTSAAMASVIPWFPYVLSIAVFLFAFSTMISWSYYGERCWVWLFGDRSSIIYKLLFLISCFLGSIITATNVLDFSDLMILGMAFPNILGMLFLSRVVRNELKDYEQKLSK
ncbi:MAG: alanine:cation symporter family protein [Opitutae bacterium]|jgi:alanine or glycine:cation symporter, AGCS family|nr:alanine:cation symporter family protein [Opitutae bacterium]